MLQSVSINQRRKQELMALQKQGKLKPEDVVEFAKDEDTALHSYIYRLGDDEAAHEYRLALARKIIRVVVTVVEGVQEPVRAFVSLKQDRQEAGGGYRETVSVMSSKNLRAQLLEQALAELEYWQKKYEHLEELAEVFAAAEQVRAKKRGK